MRIYLSSLKGFVYSIQTFVLFILRFTFLEGWGNGGGGMGAMMWRKRCVKEIKEVRDNEKVNGSDLDPACPY